MAFDSQHYIHEADKAAMKALKAIPGFSQAMKAFMKIWHEKQFRITNMSGCIKLGEDQLEKYYNMLPPICEKLGIEVPDLYLELNVNPNAYTSGDTSPFIVITSGLLETLPDELIPTVLAHECGHIACHHVLFHTMGSILLGRTSHALRSFVPLGGVATVPLEMAFFHWMRCSELSADRAAVLCDGTADKMSDVCMRFAGYDKDIQAVASKEVFLRQAHEYRNMVKDSKWDKTLEFLILSSETHPLVAVRALECEEWAKSEQFNLIMDGKYSSNNNEEEDISITAVEYPEEHKQKVKLEMPKFLKKRAEAESELGEVSVVDEIRQYKQLLDDGIITEEEFIQKKKQLMNI